MEQIESLYNWLEMNHRALAQSYADWENPNNLQFVLYCVAMYVKHASLTK